jgi:hypothetical protein
LSVCAVTVPPTTKLPDTLKLVAYEDVSAYFEYEDVEDNIAYDDVTVYDDVFALEALTA